VARYLREKRVRTMAVTDSAGHVVGVIGQSDISSKVAAEHRCPSWVHVHEIMSTELVTVTPDTTVQDCMRLMEKHNIYHLLVLDGRRNLGMVSAKDVLRMIALDEKARADLLESWAFPAS